MSRYLATNYSSPVPGGRAFLAAELLRPAIGGCRGGTASCRFGPTGSSSPSTAAAASSTTKSATARTTPVATRKSAPSTSSQPPQFVPIGTVATSIFHRTIVGTHDRRRTSSGRFRRIPFDGSNRRASFLARSTDLTELGRSGRLNSRSPARATTRIASNMDCQR